LLREAARHLVGASDDEGAAASLVGEPRLLSLAGDVETVEVRRPDGSVWVGKRGQGESSLVYAGTDQIGVYRVRGAGADGLFAAQPTQDFAVNLDPRESDPTRLTAEKRPDRVAAARAGAAKPPKHRVELWHALAALLIGIVLVESLLTLRWRGGHRGLEHRTG
jgi:hypothetical protein